jgi:hypothetical protein
MMLAEEVEYELSARAFVAEISEALEDAANDFEITVEVI